MHKISLHHLTLTELSPTEFADTAAEAGCNHVCLFIKTPGDPGPADFPRVNSVQDAKALKQRLADKGMSVCNTDTFMITPDCDPAAYSETLKISQALGAKVLNALSLDPNRAAATAKFKTFAKMAEDHGIVAILEWYRYSQVKTLKDSVAFLKEAGGQNMALNVDILHLIRNNELPKDMVGVDPKLMFYAQVADGPMKQPDDKQPDEAVANRNFPGEEEFPLVDFVKALPNDAIISIEAPVNRYRGKLSPLERAKRNVAGAKKVIAAAGRT